MAKTVPRMSFLLFGDQTGDCRPILRQVLHRKDNILLTSFLEKAHFVLREEVAHQPRLVRDQIPNFVSILDLANTYYEAGTPNSAVESTLVYICQLASFLTQYEEERSLYLDHSNTQIVGLCTGLLAASVVASSKTLLDVIPLAVEVVRVAFRTGLQVAAASRRLGHSGDSKSSWSGVIPISYDKAKAALASFHTAKGLPISSHAYISAVTRNTVTLSGPPSTLDQLFKNSAALQSSPIRLPVYGPYHASHLYGKVDLEEILGTSPTAIVNSYRPQIAIISTATGQPLTVTNTHELLRTVVTEILCEPLRWDRVLDGVVTKIISSKTKSCDVIAVGPSNLSHTMAQALKKGANVEVNLRDETAWISGQPSDLRSTGRKADSKIAIIGMSGRYPNAASNERFWDLLEKGLDVHKRIPKDRFDVDTHYDPTGKRANTSHTPYGCFIDEPGLFDPRFFSMSPREAAQTDPMHRLALVTAFEALEMSGYVPNRTPSTKLDRIGTFYGQTSDDWREVNAAQDVDTYFIPGGVRAFAPGRINYHFKFSGPSYSVDTACSSSLAAIQLACTSLWSGDCDTAVAGGMNVLTAPDIFSGLSRGQFLSKTGSCKTFDNDADGYCRGDAVASVILKRLEDAEADKDPIFGVILGSATNHSAEAVSITHPHAGAQEFLYSKVLDEAGIDPHEVSYVEMHGTGTQAGDATEMESVSNVFAPAHRRRRPDQSLHLGAVKANVGHGEASAGVTALIKVLLMLEKNTIPPHVGIKKTINQTFPTDLDARNVHIAFQPTPWPRKNGQKRIAFLNNFSAAGGNTALLLEDAAIRPAPENRDPRSTQVVATSAKSMASLRRNIESLISYIDQHPDTSLTSLSYTTTARRVQHPYRVAYSVRDLATLKKSLVNVADGKFSPVPATPPKVAFVFTGQGSQYLSLGKQLFEESTQFRSDVLHFDQIGQIQGLPSYLSLIDGSADDVRSLSPVVVQLGMTAVQMALARLWASWGIHPTVVLGHSLGEYAALNVAGVLSVSDTLHLVGQRAKHLEKDCTAGTHAMLAVKGSVASIEAAIPGMDYEIACVNSPTETVLGGPKADIEMLAAALDSEGLKCTKLEVPYAFHSAQVNPILDDFEHVAGAATFSTPRIPVISPLTSTVIRDGQTIGPAYLRRHAREKVDVLGGITAAQKEKIIDEKTVWVEIGPHPVCSGMVRATLSASAVTVPSLRRGEDAWKTVSDSLSGLHLAGLNIDWNEVHRDFNTSQQMLKLPIYSFDEKNYWLDYTNNWCLTKGDPTRTVPGVLNAATELKPKLCTSTIHRLVHEEVIGNIAKGTFQADLTEPKLHAAVSGHLVNGAPLCPSSIYADMALTIGEYLYKQLRPGTDNVDMNVGHMEVQKPLIAHPPSNGPQILQVTATADLDRGEAKLHFASLTPAGKVALDHADCTVTYEDSKVWLAEWKRSAYLFQGRIEALRKGLQDGRSVQITRGLVYKLFTALVTYNDKYRGMAEVILDSAEFEATSRVEFQTTEADGNFSCSPYWIDSLAHLAGFIVNASDAVDSKTQVYVSHGWESLRFSRKFSPEKTYRSYVKMQNTEGKVMAGDIYIFEGDEIIGVVGGLKFQCIPRSLLDTLLPPVGVTAGKQVAARPQAQRPVIKVPEKPKSSGPRPTVAKIGTASVTSKCLDIIAKEVGIQPYELMDEVVFADMGVDSLLSLTIMGRFREDLELEIPGSVFTDNPTVGELKKFLSQFETGSSWQEPADELDSGYTTPGLDSGLDTPPSGESLNGDMEDTTHIIRSTIATEMGLALEEVSDNTDLPSLGMDSLMSLSILGILREKTDLPLPANLFVEHPTIEEIEKKLGLGTPPRSARVVIEPQMIAPPAMEVVQAPVAMQIVKDDSKSLKLPPATSVLLQGRPKSASKFLFLFPDGSGSATSYVTIENISPDVCVYGLNCPFMTNPRDYTNGIDGVSRQYLDEVRRRQPKGPYYLGGWSAGGVVAFEVSKQLIKDSERVERLILIDSPCPISLEPLPSRLHHFFNDIGLLGTGSPSGPPGWLLPHFESSIANLTAYQPEPMDPSKAPQTFAVWAQHGVCQNPEDPRPEPRSDDPKSMKWLLERRTNFGFNGWDKLLGEKNIVALSSVPANHFTMMREPFVRDLTEFIQQAMA